MAESGLSCEGWKSFHLRVIFGGLTHLGGCVGDDLGPAVGKGDPVSTLGVVAVTGLLGVKVGVGVLVVDGVVVGVAGGHGSIVLGGVAVGWGRGSVRRRCGVVGPGGHDGQDGGGKGELKLNIARSVQKKVYKVIFLGLEVLRKGPKVLKYFCR